MMAREYVHSDLFTYSETVYGCYHLRLIGFNENMTFNKNYLKHNVARKDEMKSQLSQHHFSCPSAPSTCCCWTGVVCMTSETPEPGYHHDHHGDHDQWHCLHHQVSIPGQHRSRCPATTHWCQQTKHGQLVSSSPRVAQHTLDTRTLYW